MIGIDLDDDRAALEAFGDKFGSSFPIAVEDEDRMNKAFGVRGCPATVILFDGPSVGALRMNMQKTPLEGAAFTSKQRDVVARRLGVPQSAAPRNQFEYIQQLAKAGAKVLVNANAIHAFGLADDEIHPL